MWTDDLIVGIDEIDAQHRALFQHLEALLNACVEGKEQDEVLKMLGFLDGYVIAHFDTEEKLQREYDYPGYRSHRAEHVAFLHHLSNLKKEIEGKGPTRNLVLEMNQMLIDWLKRHILDVDRAAGLYLLERMKCSSVSAG